MKKIIAIFLAFVMVMGSTLTVFAAPGCFWYSPSGKPTPVVIKFDPKDENCTATLVITSYSDRHQLPETLKEMMETAYKSIAGAKDIKELNADLATLAASKGIDSKYLAVSGLFDIHAIGCDYHEEHKNFDIILSAEALENFVGLLHMNKDHKWELVTDARVENNGEHLVFSVDSFSPFAVVVDTTGTPPPTGDNVILICTIIMAASTVALAYVLVKRKKQIAQ